MKLMREYFTTPGIRKLAIIFIGLISISIAINSLTTVWVKDIIEGMAEGYDMYTSMACFFSLMAIQCLINFVKTQTRRELTQLSFTDIMNRLCEKVLRIDYNSFTSMGEGNVQSVFNFTNSVSMGGAAACQSVEAIINFLIVTVCITLISPKLLIAIVVIYTIGGYIGYGVNKKIGTYDEVTTELKGKRQDMVQKVVSGFAEIRAMNTQDQHLDQFTGLNTNMLKAFRDKVKEIGKCNGTLDAIDTVMMAAILLYTPVILRSGISTATVMTLIVYGWRLVEPLINMISYLDEYSAYKHEFAKYEEFMNTEIHIKEGKVDLKRFDSRIRFENVSFQYDNSDEVLRNVSFTVEKGQKIGIVGVSGCGKSTMLKLLERFYDPTSGRILIDGIDIKDCTFESLHSRIGIVQQDTYTFKGTILENLIYGSKASVSMGRIIDACKKAAIYDFIDNLPKKFDTDIGPNGLKLSGGQRQRIAIARIFIQDPDIILLDEATSALDNEAERIVQKSLEAMGDKTIIAVAHRLTTVKNSDKIIVMDEHQIVEEGAHEDLMLAGGVYSRLYKEKSATTL